MSVLSDLDYLLKKIESVAAHLLPFLAVAKAVAPNSTLPTVAAVAAAQQLIQVAQTAVTAEGQELTADQQVNLALNVAQQIHEQTAAAGGTTQSFDAAVEQLKPALVAVQSVNAANTAANLAAGVPDVKPVTVADLIAPVGISGVRG
jgi:type VI protein secretion system component VasK